MTDLREVLFDTLEKVRSNELPLDRAKQICDISQQIINSANAETNFIKTINSKVSSGFMGIENDSNG